MILPDIPIEEIMEKIDMDKDMLIGLINSGELWEILLRFTLDEDYTTNWMTP